MARRPFNHEAAAEMAANLSRIRAAAGSPTYGTIHLHLIVECGLTITDETVRKYHVGLVDPTTAPVEMIAALATYYGVGISEISEEAYKRASTTSDLLVRSLRWFAASDAA